MTARLHCGGITYQLGLTLNKVSNYRTVRLTD